MGLQNNSGSLLFEENGLLRFLGQQDRVDARKNTSSGDGNPRHELVDLTMEQMR